MPLSIGESLHRLIHCYKSEMKRSIAESNLSLHISHIRALKCIKRIPNCSAQSISKKMLLDKSQVTRILKELSNAGHIEKRPNPTNHRSQLLALTLSGQEALKQIEGFEHNTIAKMTAGLTERQTEEFSILADIMTGNLNQHKSD